MASVRFICGTQDIHLKLEEAIARFLGTDDTILYSSCFDANGGLFEALLGAEDVILTDELNHASIIDGVRLSKAKRRIFKHSDMADLRAGLEEARGARIRLVVTDGVFSMHGDLAKLPQICSMAEEHGALVVVDDSHATGQGRPAADAGTLWRARRWTPSRARSERPSGRLRGSSGRRELIAPFASALARTSSNSVAPPIVGGALGAIDRGSRAERLERLRANTVFSRGDGREGPYLAR